MMTEKFSVSTGWFRSAPNINAESTIWSNFTSPHLVRTTFARPLTPALSPTMAYPRILLDQQNGWYSQFPRDRIARYSLLSLPDRPPAGHLILASTNTMASCRKPLSAIRQHSQVRDTLHPELSH